ncbi:MAG: hypothetical protein E7566_04565 [Ruminococcaceae bacterium]|nr:hypothetical protein [Oscillospiraceae bacterium]
MKKVSLISQLVLINIVLLLAFIGLYKNVPFFEVSPLCAIYMAAFSFSYFAESSSTVLWIFIGLIVFNILLNVSAIVSYKKNWHNYIFIGVLAVDMIFSLLLGYDVSMTSDLMALALISVFSRNAKTY